MNTVSRRGGCDVKPIGNLRGMIEMFVQGINIFENAAAAANHKVIYCDDVLGVFWKGDTTNMLGNPSRC